MQLRRTSRGGGGAAAQPAGRPPGRAERPRPAATAPLRHGAPSLTQGSAGCRGCCLWASLPPGADVSCPGAQQPEQNLFPPRHLPGAAALAVLQRGTGCTESVRLGIGVPARMTVFTAARVDEERLRRGGGGTVPQAPRARSGAGSPGAAPGPAARRASARSARDCSRLAAPQDAPRVTKARGRGPPSPAARRSGPGRCPPPPPLRSLACLV